MSTPLPQVSDPALSLAEAAAILGCSKRGVYWMVRDGVLPAFKLRRYIRIRASDVQAHIDAHRYQPKPDPKRFCYR